MATTHIIKAIRYMAELADTIEQFDDCLEAYEGGHAGIAELAAAHQALADRAMLVDRTLEEVRGQMSQRNASWLNAHNQGLQGHQVPGTPRVV